MVYPGTLGRYLLINYPDAAEAHSVHVKYVDGVEQCQLVGWLQDYGDPPSPEQVAAWEAPPLSPLPPPLKAVVRAQLDPDEESRKALLRDMRSEAMAALIAGGMSKEQAQAAGQEFCMDYSSEIYAFEFGASKAFFELVSADEREWLSLPWPGHGGATIRDVFIGSKS